jgi:hypothetical protein
MKWKRFIVYSLFSWVGPVLITTLTVLCIFIINRHSTHLGYSWSITIRVIAVLISATFFIVMTLNIAFFSWSAYLVYSSKSEMENRSTEKTQLCPFVRLFVIMGIIWAVDMVATLLGITGKICS